MTRSINFFDIENILLKTDESYAPEITKTIERLGYQKIFVDKEYSLYFRKTAQYEYLKIDFMHPNEYQIGYGWGVPEDKGRWVVGRGANVFFKLNTQRQMKLSFICQSLEIKQSVAIYINGEFIESVKISGNSKKYSVKTKSHLRPGINKVNLVFKKTFTPANVLPDSKDMRKLAVFFNEIKLEQ